ncbi:hypothetical protein LCGC14_0446320 [marine sediment metagenome]|uniref:Uncharacterized protein n=1 Tax=marine sediment metagenome TaxID=412755 RepID=A0A0F9T2A2_9ZZZZ
MGTWSWTREARIVGALKSQGLTNRDIIGLYKSDGIEGLEDLAG